MDPEHHPRSRTVKDKEARVVVLHPHLVEMGFVDFARAGGKGHLFLTPSKGGDWRGPWISVKNRIREMARAAIGGAEVAPNHGWRHRFKTVGRGAGVSDALLDHITGHAPATVGRSYGTFPLSVQAKAMAHFPRYSVD